MDQAITVIILVVLAAAAAATLALLLRVLRATRKASARVETLGEEEGVEAASMQ